MRQKSTSSMGALHPILFFLVIYGISLFLALFVCRTVYFSLHDEATNMGTAIQGSVSPNTMLAATALK
jgi:hypothetical protein